MLVLINLWPINFGTKYLAKARELNHLDLNKLKHETISRNDLVGAFLELRIAPSQCGQGRIEISVLHDLNDRKEKLDLLKQTEQVLRSDELTSSKADVIEEIVKKQRMIVKKIHQTKSFFCYAGLKEK